MSVMTAAKSPAPAFDAAALEGPARLAFESLGKVQQWVEEHGYEAYEPFDGLSTPLRAFTRHNLLLDRLLQQVGRQSPINFRPLLGIKPRPSTKGRGYMAAGYLKMYQVTGDARYVAKAKTCLEWLIDNKSPKFADHSWANHFEYASRGGRYGHLDSIIVWSSLIGQAFIDAYDLLGEARYLDIAESVCRWIMSLPRGRTPTGTGIGYHMQDIQKHGTVHNASMLGAALLARTWRHTRRQEYLDLAQAAMEYSCTRLRDDGSWWYADFGTNQWIDNFHTGYNLDSLKCYIDQTGDTTWSGHLDRAFEYFFAHFFESSGRPKYYHNRAYPIDIQCASQAIETLTRFADRGPEVLQTATSVARWTIENMQDRTGYFYYRRYPLGVVAKIPMLHWGQATMFNALSLLVSALLGREASHIELRA
jgi:rhamnogalacturonyl hydrolase YesR